MRLLLVGDNPSDIPKLLAVFPEVTTTVSHCADASQALAALLEARWEFDWVILAGSGAVMETRFASLVAELDRPIRVGVLDGVHGSRPSLSMICAPRNSADGVHFLRCALSRPGAVQIHQRNVADEEGSTLEYHSPYRRGGKSSTSTLTVWNPVPDSSARKRSRVLPTSDMQRLRKIAGRGER